MSSESTHPESEVISCALYEPQFDSITEIDPAIEKPLYETIRDALADGWRIIHFPNQREPSNFDVIGYQFILEKLEEYMLMKNIKHNLFMKI